MALLAEFFGGTPKVPDFEPIDVQAQQKKAISGNAAALPQLQQLGSRINTFNQNEINRMLEMAMPGYSKLRDKTTSNIMDWSSGKLPQDVSDEVARNAATRALYGGYGGTGMGRNLTARDLGLTSLDLMTKGFDAATRWMGMSKAPQFDVSSMFISPQFQTQFAQQERDSKFQHDYVKNQWDWYGSFGQQATRFEDTVAQLAASIGGSMMG